MSFLQKAITNLLMTGLNQFSQLLNTLFQVVGVPKDAAVELKDSFIDFAEQNDMLMMEVPEDPDVSKVEVIEFKIFIINYATGFYQRLDPR